MPKINGEFIKLEVKHPAQGQIIIRDSELQGFGLRVTKGSMAYIAECRVGGRPKRITIGKCDLLTPSDARRLAKRALAEMSIGRMPRRLKSVAPTLLEVLEKFLITRNLRASSIEHYNAVIRRCLGDWLGLRIDQITKEMVLQRHKELTRPTKQKSDGRAQANKAMETLRSILNFARDTYDTAYGEPIITVNPVIALSRNRSWHKTIVRQRIIPDKTLPLWYQDIANLRQTQLKDYMLMLLLTGLRRNECATLRWTDIDFGNRTITVRAGIAKNGREHVLPMSDFVYQLLKYRYECQARKIEYVFPGRGATKHMVDSKHVISQISHRIDYPFVLHDLRRTFLSRAERLGLSYFMIKRLANHGVGRDITAGYIVYDLEQLREPVQRITDDFLKAMGCEKPANLQSTEPLVP